MKDPSDTAVAPKFDAKSVRQLLIENNKLISELWPKLGVPENAKNDDSDYLLPGNKNLKKKKNIVPAGGDGKISQRAKSLEELHEKLLAIRGKKLGYKEKLAKKGLKNRLIKKQKKEERKTKKQLIKAVPNIDIKQQVKPVKPVFNNEGKMVFSKFDFSESGVKEEKKDKHEKKEKLEKKPQKILQKLQKENEKLKSLETQGETEKATQLKEKLSWKRALDKAEGKKVKDNPELLKKTIKKEEKKKQKSKKKWQARLETVDKKKDEKQKKRTENIEARKKQVKITKLKKAAKKGRIIPGF